MAPIEGREQCRQMPEVDGLEWVIVMSKVPLRDPNHVQEVYASDVTLRVVSGMVHLTFSTVRPGQTDAVGKLSSERVVTGRVVMSMRSTVEMASCLQQFVAVLRKQQSAKPN